MKRNNIYKGIFIGLAVCWWALSYVGTLVDLAYHTDLPIAPQVWQGIEIAIIPPLFAYLTVFHLIPWLREFFRDRSLL